MNLACSIEFSAIFSGASFEHMSVDADVFSVLSRAVANHLTAISTLSFWTYWQMLQRAGVDLCVRHVLLYLVQ